MNARSATESSTSTPGLTPRPDTVVSLTDRRAFLVVRLEIA